MLVEQLLKDIQKLIDRGTISSSADINIVGQAYDLRGYMIDINFEDVEIGIDESSYNRLILIPREKVE